MTDAKSPNIINVLGFEKTLLQWVGILMGPLFYFIILALPLGGDVTARGGLAIIAWVAWYWGTGAINTGYCIVIPILGTAFLPGMEWGKIVQTLLHPGLGMLLGPAMIVCMWSRWGFTRRLALFFLNKVGTSVRAQAIVWLVLATSTSFLVANVVIAIAYIPVALEMLKSVGYDTGEKLVKSKSAMLIVIAVGIGASLGGIMTPMAGGQAVITWEALNQALGGTVTMIGFTTRMVVPVFLSLIPVLFLFWLLFPVDVKRFEGSKEYFAEELRKMGKLSKSEIWGVVLFLFAVSMPFLQPLWQPYMPAGINPTPSAIFMTFCGILALLPAPDSGAPIKNIPYQPGERLLSMNSLKVFPVQAFLIWPTAMSISILVNETGAANIVSGWLGSYWAYPAFVGVAIFVAFCLLLAQPCSDTGAAGILAPVVALSTLAAGENPIPWLLILGFTVNFSFMVPTATGTIALPIALEGKATWRLPVYGLACVIVCGLVSFAFWGSVLHFDWQFWQTLPIIPLS